MNARARNKPRLDNRPADVTPVSTPSVPRRIVKLEIAISPGSDLVEYARIDGRMFLPAGFSAHNEGLEYAPNRKYQVKDFVRFEYWYELRKSQELAYDDLVREDPNRFRLDKSKSFIERYRVWKQSK